MVPLGLVLMILGFLVYAGVAPEWQQSQSFLGQVAAAFSSDARTQIEMLRTYYFGSIAAMVGGGLLFLHGLATRGRG